jgi:hypothetical protein
MDWTVDTQVLYVAARYDMEAIRLLADILGRRNGVGFDDSGQIRRQYDNCAKATRSEFIRKWVAEAASKLAQMRSGRLSETHRAGLERLGFHQKDWVFVAVCYRIEGRTLVAEESDYREEVRAYLNAEMGISVLSVAGSLERIDQPGSGASS